MTSPMAKIQNDARDAALELGEILNAQKYKVVFAESCTSGLVSGLLAQTPGISQWHCGSAVVYQVETKEQWLDIDPDILVNPGPVSEIVARKMAEGVLKKTKQAQLSGSITGHLGPDAPAEQDGLVYVGISLREKSGKSFNTEVTPYWLAKNSELLTPLESETELRLYRQYQAAHIVLLSLIHFLKEH